MYYSGITVRWGCVHVKVYLTVKWVWVCVCILSYGEVCGVCRLQGGWGYRGSVLSVPVDPDEAVTEHGLWALHGPLGLIGAGELDQRPLWITLVCHLVTDDGY